MIGQKKTHKTVYWGNKISYPTFDFLLFILALGAGDSYFEINLYGYRKMRENSNNKIDLEFS